MCRQLVIGVTESANWQHENANYQLAVRHVNSDSSQQTTNPVLSLGLRQYP